MKVDWSYTDLAKSYVNRPDYAPDGIDEIFRVADLKGGCEACDIGAGVGHLTIPLLERGANVSAVEPNDAMRGIGVKRTSRHPNVSWHVGTGEETGMNGGKFDIATFGSSFNVVDREKALVEVIRILKPRGWFACMWNHRDLADPLQAEVEELIKSRVPGYGYGSRREDQADVIRSCGMFDEPIQLDADISHTVEANDWIDAWRSHATLQRHAKDDFISVVEAIEKMVSSKNISKIVVPYTTRIWIAQSAQ